MPEPLVFDRETAGRLMHESWSETKRAQGFHGPKDECTFSAAASWRSPEERDRLIADTRACCGVTTCCSQLHADLIPWAQLPEAQKDINRRAFDKVLPYFEQQAQAAIAAVVEKAAQHVPTWSFVNGRGSCSCGGAVADGVTPYAKIWAEHIGSLAKDAQDALREAKAQAVNAAQDDLFSLLMNVAQLLYTLEEQQRATKWTRQIKVDVDKRLEAMDKVREEAK